MLVPLLPSSLSWKVRGSALPDCGKVTSHAGVVPLDDECPVIIVPQSVLAHNTDERKLGLV